jgi:hypothetical protein
MEVVFGGLYGSIGYRECLLEGYEESDEDLGRVGRTQEQFQG